MTILLEISGYVFLHLVTRPLFPLVEHRKTFIRHTNTHIHGCPDSFSSMTIFFDELIRVEILTYL